MAVYEYTGLNAKGKKAHGVIEADSSKLAQQRLKTQGIFVTKIAEAYGVKADDRKARKSLGAYFERIKPQEVVILTRQLATLVSANIPLIQALSALVDQTDNVKLKSIVTQVKEQVNEGASLAQAMRSHPKIFTDLFVNMVEAGEHSGALDVVLERLADFTESQQALRGRLKSAMIYPIVMSIIAAGVVFFMMTFVIPRFITIFETTGRALPTPTLILQAASKFTASYWWAMVATAATLSFLFRRYINTENGRYRWDRLRLNAPVLGSLIRKIAVSRFSRTLSTLLSNGIPLLQALDIVKTILENAILRDAVENARESISEGASIAAPLKESGVFPPLVTHMIAIGEQSGDLETMLLKVANSYDTEVETAIDALTSRLEPLIIVVMAAVVGFIVIAALLPIVGMTQGIM